MEHKLHESSVKEKSWNKLITASVVWQDDFSTEEFLVAEVDGF
jgi:hypothetical protein